MEDEEKDKKFKNSEIAEDATQYGEFISSFFAWQTPKEQRKRVQNLEDIPTNKNKKQQRINPN